MKPSTAKLNAKCNLNHTRASLTIYNCLEYLCLPVSFLSAISSLKLESLSFLLPFPLAHSPGKQVYHLLWCRVEEFQEPISYAEQIQLSGVNQFRCEILNTKTTTECITHLGGIYLICMIFQQCQCCYIVGF